MAQSEFEGKGGTIVLLSVANIFHVKLLNRKLLNRLLLYICLIFASLACIWSYVPAAYATVPTSLLKQTAIEVKVNLGNSANELKFEPNHLDFVSGKRYNLHLLNPSPQKHYFTAKDFADGMWTQKVEAGKVEIKGAIHELELKPGAEAEWVFLSLKPGKYSLRCTIPGHAEAGMTGEIAVK
ncbi:plastocyanin/azurin family copper-binding protein [Calothrix sp. UHCC 0171]|uniref:plastocyanin/azurin family copper-binding protein n=1 Tax=Calothrix sp. UHCC 0171 TaxID=3110245 RepID=UPI002B1EF482|nr:plastocyanin/azurin family copper-binding protein [Calothrix sp. UHCC 0171]MEA5573992.1 plastocyanin/azurin family copper-binding protein [Calothrix sp. UHCC 0171]